MKVKIPSIKLPKFIKRFFCKHKDIEMCYEMNDTGTMFLMAKYECKDCGYTFNYLAMSDLSKVPR